MVVLVDASSADINCNPIPFEVKFLCGADVLQSFNVPDLWKLEHVRCVLVIYFKLSLNALTDKVIISRAKI